MDDDNERFIDVENNPERYGQQESYETIVTKQIGECVKTLSRPLFISTATTSKNSGSVSLGDQREAVINSVDTLRMLMSPFLTSKDESIKIVNETESFINKFGERKIRDKNGVLTQIKDSKEFNQDALVWGELFTYKVKQARKLFEALIKAYHINKTRLAEFSQE